MYCYKLGGLASSTGGNLIRIAMIELKGVSNNEHLVLDTINHSRYVWSTPGATNTSYNLDEISNLVISVALSLLGSVVASVVWATVAAVLNILKNGCNDITSQDNHKVFAWSWGSDIDKTSQHASFYALVDPGHTVSFTSQYAILGPIYELLTTGVFTFEMTAPGPYNSTPSEMSLQERENYGISTIPRVQLQNARTSFMEAGFDVDTLLETGDDEFYFTTSAPTCTITTPNVDEFDYSTLETNTSLSEITAQIERSLMIIDALDKPTIRSMDGSTEMIQKHRERVAALVILRSNLQMTSFENGGESVR